MKCSFCGKAEAVERKPKQYDFSFKHAMKRYAVPERSQEIQFQRMSYFFEDDAERLAWFAAHPGWMVTDWYNICANCLPHVQTGPESQMRLFNFLERRIGTERMNKAIETAVKENFPLLIRRLRHGKR